MKSLLFYFYKMLFFNTMEPKKDTIYHCINCGFVYSAVLGDPEHGVYPGTAFENLPPRWQCPQCGKEKKNFIPLIPQHIT
jgi:rubredoxin